MTVQHVLYIPVGKPVSHRFQDLNSINTDFDQDKCWNLESSGM
jgi:hypothetical protein